MTLKTSNSFEVRVKSISYAFKRFLSFISLVLAIVALIYLVYWCLAMVDDVILDYSEQIFLPIANFLSPDVDSLEVYKLCAIKLFLGILPCLLLYYLTDKFEEILIKSSSLSEVISTNRVIEKHQREILNQYEVIKNYAICLSVDYDNEKNKSSFNMSIYKKIKTLLSNALAGIQINTSDVLIVKSDNFAQYDEIFTSMLKVLSEIKKIVEKQYKLKFIPSITTFAYEQEPQESDIRKSHFEILSFNFKNRALSDALFRKKYKFLGLEKFAGIPIGEYAYFGADSPCTYELNIVFKNLTNELAKGTNF